MAGISSRQYRHVFVPLLDVWLRGGQSVLTGLVRQREGKNLLIVPYHLVRQLGDISKDERDRDSIAAKDALQALKDLEFTPDKDVGERRRYGAPTAFSESLDVKMLDLPEVVYDDKRSARELNLDALSGIVRGVTKKHPLFITDDEGVLIYGKMHQLRAEQPRFLMVRAGIVNEGVIEGSDELLAKLEESQEHRVPEEVAVQLMNRELYPNQFIVFGNGPNSRYAKVGGKPEIGGRDRHILGLERIVRLLPQSDYAKKLHYGEETMPDILGVMPRDMEQYLAMQHILLNPDITMKFITGKASTGKTLLAYACAVYQTLCAPRQDKDPFDHISGRYKQVILFKSNDQMGGKEREMGFLPGDIEDKLGPFMESYGGVHDSTKLRKAAPFEAMILDPNSDTRLGAKRPQSYDLALAKQIGKILPQDEPALVLKHSGHTRGVTFNNAVVIIDEAQNFTPYEIKTLIQRQGQNCVYIITGDPRQLDNRTHCSSDYNGLTQSVQHFLNRPSAALINLNRPYRGQDSMHAESMRDY